MTTLVGLPEGAVQFAALAHDMAAHESATAPLWLMNLRKECLDRFTEMGFPTPALEDWKYTSLAPILRTNFARFSSPAGSLKAAAQPLLERAGKLARLGGGAHTLVFFNGVFVPELSHLDGSAHGLEIETMAHAISRKAAAVQPRLGSCTAGCKNGLVALNGASFADGAFISVANGAVIAEPIHILNLTDGSTGKWAIHPRNLILLGETSQATIVETVLGDGEVFFNPVTEVFLGPHASLDHYVVQEHAIDSFHTGNLVLKQSRGAQAFCHTFSAGGRIVRNELTSVLDGEGAGVTLDGLFLVRGTQHVDNHTVIDHARPHCGSQEFYKGILDGQAHGVFDGKIVVRPHAEKSDAHQKNRNLLLSGEALIDSKPQLEIYNNDVKCTHGATTGRLDPDSLFYLKSRGLDETAARSLLTYAFGSEILSRVKIDALRSHLEARLLDWLPAASGPAVR
jgi:Fe-S cluster assembly protein SufD